MSETSTIIISGYRATSIVDTPMRKIELLEAVDGRVILRETSFDYSRNRAGQSASVSTVHLEHYEAEKLGKALLNLEDTAADDKPRAAGFARRQA